jgi:mannosyltransferase OCH1-like enzyme
MDEYLIAVNRWRMKAEEYRAIADQARSPVARDTYESLAESYDSMALHAERIGALQRGPVRRRVS